MVEEEIFQLKNTLERLGNVIYFSGPFSQEMIEAIGNSIKVNLTKTELVQKSIFNIFSIFIEQSQNIRNYIISRKESAYYNILSNSSTVSISYRENGYHICSANIIENHDLDQLIQRIGRIQNLSKDELKILYKQQINKEHFQNSHGAGLGLIEIARRASFPLDYSVRKFNDNLSYFLLSTTV